MEGDGVVGASDLVSMLPADIFADSGAGDTGDVSAADGGEVVDDPVSAEVPESEPAVEETAEEAPAEELEQPAEEQPREAAPGEDLPEGVRAGKDRHGRDGVWVEKARWENAIHPHHKVFQEASQIIGEPLTVEALRLRDEAYMGQERMYTDVLSGDPSTQAKVFGDFIAEARAAMQNGIVQNDPVPSMAEAFYTTLEKQSPDGYAKVRTLAAKSLGEEMYREAAEMFRSGNADAANNLFRATGYILSTLGLPFRQDGEREGFLSTFGQQDEAMTLRAKVQELEGKLSGSSATSQAAQLDSWRAATKKASTESVVANAIKPALTETEAAWSKLKGGATAFNDLVLGRLRSAVFRSISEDARFMERINLLDMQARRASAQGRAAIAEQIKQAYVNRAKPAVEAHKREVLDFAARTYKERSNENHKRLAAGQNQRTPTGAHNPTPRGITPPAPKPASGGFFDADAEARRWASVLGS